MKLTLRKDTAMRIVARLLLEASRLELNHRTPVTGEKFTVRPVTIEREIARLRCWARQLRKAIACRNGAERREHDGRRDERRTSVTRNGPHSVYSDEL